MISRGFQLEGFGSRIKQRLLREFKDAPRRTIRIVKRFGWWKVHAVKSITADVAEVLVEVLGVAEYAD
jgi:hypothetical protein